MVRPLTEVERAVAKVVAPKLSADVLERMRRVRLLLLDVDGVLTDGGLYYANSGDEWKRFDVKDGAGLWMASKSGIEVGILTAKSSPLVLRRAEEFGITGERAKRLIAQPKA